MKDRGKPDQPRACQKTPAGGWRQEVRGWDHHVGSGAPGGEQSSGWEEPPKTVPQGAPQCTSLWPEVWEGPELSEFCH